MGLTRQEILDKKEEELIKRELEHKYNVEMYSKNRKIDIDYEGAVSRTKQLEYDIELLKIKRDSYVEFNRQEVENLKSIIRLKDGEIERLYNLLKLDKQYQK